MQLGVKKGDEILVKIEGDDEDAAAAAIENFLKANL
jgi:phosphocarrier protein HPr